MVSLTHSQGVPSSRTARPAATKSGRLPLLVVLYLLAVMLPIGFSAGPIYLTTTRLVLLISVVPLSVMLFLGRFDRVRTVDIFFLLFLMWTIFAYGMHHPESVVEHMGANGLEFWGGYVLGRCLIRTRQQFIALCKLLFLLVALTLPLALFESQTGTPIVLELIRSLPGVRTLADVHHELRMGLERSQVVFVHPIIYGLFCSVAFSLTFVGMKGMMSNTRRWISAIIVGLCTFLSLSSGAILALVLQLFMIIWFTRFREHTWKWTYLLILFIMAYIAIDLMSNRTPIRVFMTYATFNPGTAYWRGLIFDWGIMNIIGSVENNIPASPWIGIGHNDWVRPQFMVTNSVDNFWLLVPMTYGIPAFVFLVIGYGWTIFRVGYRDFKGDTELENLRRAWVFTFVGLTFTLITVHIWATIYSFVFFLFGAGVWFVTAAPIRDEDALAEATGPEPEPRSRYTRFPTRPGHNRPQPAGAALQMRRGNSA